MSLAYGAVTGDAPAGHDVSKPGWFLYLFSVGFVSLYLSRNLEGTGGGEKAGMPRDPFLDPCANWYMARYMASYWGGAPVATVPAGVPLMDLHESQGVARGGLESEC